MQARAQSTVLRNVLRLPPSVLRRIAGAPTRIDGQELDLRVQAMLRLQHLTGQTQLSANTTEAARAGMRRGTEVLQGPAITGVDVTGKHVPTSAGGVGARLYQPKGLGQPSTLLVYYHGGGWVLGDLDSHDSVCRFLARHAGVRVLSVDYRLAPEHPFPAAVDDAVESYRYAVEHADELGTSADSIAVGGDSAGGNLAAAVSQYATGSDLKAPVLQVLLYPAVDASTRRRSRELFSDGLLLTDEDMDWFMDHYQPDEEQRGDPRLSVLLADDLTGQPPAYLATAGFDPLRDEGEEYGRRLREAGVPVVARRFDDLVHGFLQFHGIVDRSHEALLEIAGSLRTALALHA
nr:alpha/beta hydrolase [Halosaccharopolyspora lacisalsi]